MSVTARRRSSETGAVAIMVAACLTAILVAAAMVLDFGLARLDRQTNKSVADTAAAAGLEALSTDFEFMHPWAGVCEAVSFLKANMPALTSAGLTETWENGAGGPPPDPSPCSSPAALAAKCVPGTADSFAWYTGTVGPSERMKVEVKSGYNVSDGGFPEESYGTLLADQGESARGGCDQLAVIITQKRRPGIGSLATSSDLTTRIRSVGRVVPGGDGKAPVALLILERHDCSAISTDGNTTQLWVKGAGERPGLIHSDSLGDSTTAAGKCNSTKVVGGSGQVKAFKAETGDATGIIGIRALWPSDPGVPSKAFDPPPAVVAEGAPGDEPEGRPLVTRAPVDERYLQAVRDKAAAAAPLFDSASALAAGYVDSGITDCGGTGISGTFTQSKVYVDCPGGATFADATFAGTSVIFNGPVTVKSNKSLKLPNATSVYIKGNPTANANDIGLNVRGNFLLHDAGQSSCAATDSATSGSSLLLVARGQVASGGSPSAPFPSVMRMCHTAVVALGACPLPSPYDYSDKSLAPEPANNSCNGNVSLVGGTTTDWTAPNANPSTPSDATDWANLEDLALWTETSNESSVGGGGYMTLSGVFMLPNANPFSIGGNGGQDVEDSQYIARKLNAHGGGRLEMAPDPNDSLNIDYFGDYVLVR